MSRRPLVLRPGSNAALKRKRDATPEDEEKWAGTEWDGFGDDDPMPVPATDDLHEKSSKEAGGGANGGVEGDGDAGKIGQQSGKDAGDDETGENLDATADLKVEAQEYCNLLEKAPPKRKPGAKPDEFDIADNEHREERDPRHSGSTDESDSDGDTSSPSDEDDDEEEEDDDDDDDMPAASAIFTAAELSPEESDLDTMAYFWNAASPSIFIPDAIQPRGDSTMPLPFETWGKSLKAELAILSRLVDSSTAKDYIQEAFDEREGRKNWLIAADVQ